MIQCAFTLETAQFEAATPQEGSTNSRCFGEDFARWLKAQLQREGVVTSEPIQEDWGWALVVPFRGHRFTLSIGVMDASMGKTPSEWRVGVSYERGLNGVRAWFRTAPAAELSALGQHLGQTLRSNARIEGLAAE